MRIVKGPGADPLVVADETLAVSEAIGLEADESGAVPVIANDHVPRSLALAAEGGDLFGVQAPERLGQCLEVVVCGISHVLPGAGMAAFAFQAGRELFKRELFARDHACSVAVEAAAAFPYSQLAAHGLCESGGVDLLIAGRGGQGVVARVVADQALVEVAILLEDP